MKPKRVIAPILLVVLLAAAGFGIWKFFLAEPEGPDDALVLYGNIDIRQVELAFNGSERVAEVRVEEGDRVEKGQIVATLETQRLEQAVNAAEGRLDAQRAMVAKLTAGNREPEIQRARSEVNTARTRAANARRTYRRLRPLGPKNLASENSVDNARSAAEAAEAQLAATEEGLNLLLDGFRVEDIDAAEATLRALEADLALAQERLDDATLIAPADGIVRNRILEPGDMATPARPAITLALVQPVWARTYIPETDLGRVFPGMRAEIHTDTFPDKAYPGWVGFISPTAEFTPKNVETPEIRTHLVYQIRVHACSPENELRLGMPVTVRIPLNQDPADSEAEGAQRPCGSGTGRTAPAKGDGTGA
jgi:HlyD family secretion protein